MNNIIFRIRGSRKTTRDGSHPDDQAYLDQLVDTVVEKLKDLELDVLVDVELFDPVLLRSKAKSYRAVKAEDSSSSV